MGKNFGVGFEAFLELDLGLNYPNLEFEPNSKPSLSHKSWLMGVNFDAFFVLCF